MKKKVREIVFNKYGGKCAYCGCDLEKGWHVDELLPVIRSYAEDFKNNKLVRKVSHVMYPERFNIDNQMPACASCNINKHSMSLEEFRKLIMGFLNHLNNISVQYKISKRYGLVKENIKPIVLYFETFCKPNIIK